MPGPSSEQRAQAHLVLDMFSDDANDAASVDVWELPPDGLRWPLASIGADGMLPCPGAVLRRGVVARPFP